MRTSSAARVLVATVTLACWPGSLTAQVMPVPDSGPRVLTFENLDETKGTLELLQNYDVRLPVTFTVINPAGVRELLTKYVVETRARMTSHALGETVITTVDGKQLTSAEAAKQLKKGQAVVVLETGTPLPKTWLELLRMDALIVEVKSFQGTPPAAAKVPKP